MSNFKIFQDAISEQFTQMLKTSGTLFRVDATSEDRNYLWESYLAAFPEGSNPMYRERTEHDCQCCKQFIRNAAGIVTIKNNKLVSIWDINIDSPYQTVANAMSALIAVAPIANVFFHYEKEVGTAQNRQLIDDGGPDMKVKTWEHFHLALPNTSMMHKDSIATKMSALRSSHDVFKRSLEEIAQVSIETVIELIQQGSLYRGDENLKVVQTFLKYKKDFSKIDIDLRDNYVWANLDKASAIARIRNTAMGTLLVDLSEGKPLDIAVTAFETMVAPANYKRPTALITKSMITAAQTEIESLGLTEALQRRYAVTEDLTINNVLFADRSIKKIMNPFDEMSDEVKVNTDSLKKIETISADTFINDILPKAETIELLPENSHINNFVSLIAPTSMNAPNLFKWNNNFSWAYNGDVTDSIKERVKQAGGDVTGDLRCSLSWFNYDDLDIHVIEPNGNELSFSNKWNRSTGGKLDVDMNVGSGGSREAVENITWPSESKMLEGTYKVFVNNYTKRESIDVGFNAEIEFRGEILSFGYAKAVSSNKNVTVAEFHFSKKDGLTIINSLESEAISKHVWGIDTGTFRKVEMIMMSPNHWDGQEQGNKHVFFMLDKCINEDPSRGFFNEFLNSDLLKHRKVLEVLGTKTKTACSDNQLSGLGFSSTQRKSVTCKVTGTYNRIVNINF